jgi:chorismate dehydratase
MLRIGWIDYANCTPLLLQIESQLPAGKVSLTHGVPAELNAALAGGEIDLCISSSIEFARHADQYLVLPGHCIGSRGAVQSVLLLTDRPVNELAGQRLLVTAESATSVVLLQILLSRHWGVSGCTVEATKLPWDQALSQAHGVLVIGDGALKAAISGTAPFCYDLGAAWFEMTGLPFVFALWQVNRKAAVDKADRLNLVLELLDQARDRIHGEVRQLAARAGETAWIDAGQLADYWQHITYHLDEEHLAGLTSYYQLAFELGLLAAVPKMQFYKAEQP